MKGAGPSSWSVVEQTRPQSQAASTSSSQNRQHASDGLDLPPELLGRIAEQLPPIDLLMMSQTNHQLRDAAQPSAALQQRRQRAIRIQSVWNWLTAPRAGVADRFATLLNPIAIRSLPTNFDCLTRGSRRTWSPSPSGLTTPSVASQRPWCAYVTARVPAPAAPRCPHRAARPARGSRRGPAKPQNGVADLNPALQDRLVVIAEPVDGTQFHALAVEVLGRRVADLAPALQAHLIVFAERLTRPLEHVIALQELGSGHGRACARSPGSPHRSCRAACAARASRLGPARPRSERSRACARAPGAPLRSRRSACPARGSGSSLGATVVIAGETRPLTHLYRRLPTTDAAQRQFISFSKEYPAPVVTLTLVLRGRLVRGFRPRICIVIFPGIP